MKVNGESIYGTRPWTKAKQWTAGEQPKIGYNQEFETSYDFSKLIAAPRDGKASIEAFFTGKGDRAAAVEVNQKPVSVFRRHRFRCHDVNPNSCNLALHTFYFELGEERGGLSDLRSGTLCGECLPLGC